jgi:hypothetical protein
LLGPLREINRERYGEYGFESELVGYEADDPKSSDALEAARAIIEAANRPLSRSELGRELAQVAAVTVSNRAPEDQAGWAAVMLIELQDFPGEAVRTALRTWARREKFLPTLAEIREDCHWHSRRRLALRRLLERP